MMRLPFWLMLVFGFGLSTAVSADLKSDHNVAAISVQGVARTDCDEIFVNEKNEVFWNGRVVSEPDLLQLLKQAQANAQEPDLEIAPEASEEAGDKVFIAMFQHGFYPLKNKVLIDDENHMLWNGSEINSVILWNYLDQLNKKFGSSHYIQFDASSGANKNTVFNTLALLKKSEGLVEDLTSVETDRN
jgi:biopolymer transport protein ExbD